VLKSKCTFLNLHILRSQQHPAFCWLAWALAALRPFEPPLLTPSLSRSSALIEFYFLIKDFVISRKQSSTPYPVLALVFITLRLWVYSNTWMSSSVTSISLSWSSSSSYSWLFSLGFFTPTSHLLAITMTLTSVPQCFSISFNHPSTLTNDSLSVKSKTTRIPSAPL